MKIGRTITKDFTWAKANDPQTNTLQIGGWIEGFRQCLQMSNFGYRRGSPLVLAATRGKEDNATETQLGVTYPEASHHSSTGKN